MEPEKRRHSIELLLEDDENSTVRRDGHEASRSPRGKHRIALVFSIILNLTLLIIVFALYRMRRTESPLTPWPTTVYSPAQHVVEYETVEFVTNLRADAKHAEKNVYLELTDEGDAAWDTLAEVYATSAIPHEQAHRLNQPTAPSPHDPALSLVGLSVFHQLHCLSRIRKLLHPERYASNYGNLSQAETAVHDDHCVDLIRQSLMCQADISPITWKWNERTEIALPNAKSIHVCRKWGPIWDWAVQNKAMGMWQGSHEARGG